MRNNKYSMEIKVPFDQFQIGLMDSNGTFVIREYCEIDYNQYLQENLDSIKRLY